VKLDQAEHARDTLEAKLAAERADLDKAEAELNKRRRMLNDRHQRERAKIDARLERVRESYEHAISEWRSRDI
jgi:hypothetical protein